MVSKYTKTMIKGNQSCVDMTTNTSKPSRSNTPANMPAAKGRGTRSMKRSNQPLKPTKVTIRDDMTKAATTSPMGQPGAEMMSMAAPEVDHAVTMGVR
jgi:hypothetical protein